MGNRFCIRKTTFLFVSILILILSVSVFTSHFLLSTKKTTNSRASEPNSTKQILNGVKAEYNEFPFAAFVISNRGICSGFLIHEEWVVTAAHCFEKSKTDPSFDSAVVANILIGSNYVDSTFTGLHFSESDKIIPYSQTNSSDGDIALIHLKTPAKGIPTISILDPQTDLNNDGYITNLDYPEVFFKNNSLFSIAPDKNSICTIMGYGRTSDLSSWSSDLLKGRMYIDGRKSSDGKYFSVSPVGNAMPCYGDSGSVLVREIFEKPYVIGVLSAGDAETCSEVKYSVYVSIYRFASWIKANTGFSYSAGTYVSLDNPYVPVQTSQVICENYNNDIERCNRNTSICGYYTCKNECHPVNTKDVCN